MKKTYFKLAVAFFALLLSVTMVVSVTYAWTTLSKNPVASGIQVTVGGGNTIMLAADVAKTLEDGTVVHYPAEFSNGKLKFDNIQGFTGLSPVSSADGLNWILAEYDENTGNIKDISEFTVDNTLSAANNSDGNGKYVYLDFWIVSPGSEYSVHISTDQKTGEGSFVMELPEVVEGNTTSGYTLSDTRGMISASARVGFLVNNSTVTNENDMLSYIAGGAYDERYKSLKGVYQEKGDAPQSSEQYTFTVYEPNALLHPLADTKIGDYYITYPLSYNSELGICETDIGGHVAIQANSNFVTTENGLLLEDILQTALVEKKIQSADEARTVLFNDRLQWQISSYITSGLFFKNASNIYSLADRHGKVEASIIDGNDVVAKAGAADDVVITKLERNVPQRIRMFIWIEGQDIDCVNDSCVPKTGFAINLELSGATK